MRQVFGALLSALVVVTFGSCGQSVPTSDSQDLLAAVGGTDRPLKGTCDVVVAQRTHEEGEGETGGGCGGGGGEEDPGGGPPIARHYNLTGTCQLTHLGRVGVEGRLNVTGPFGMGGEHGGAAPAAEEGEGGHGGGLAVRGRLMFVAADGDQLTGRYVPVSVAFDKAPGPDGNGGTLVFTSVQKIGEACTGHEGEGSGGMGMGGPGGNGGGEEGEEHEEPVSTGRFVGATGQVTLLGRLVITKNPKEGRGVIALTDGVLTY
jgi:hypothetical protein